MSRAMNSYQTYANASTSPSPDQVKAFLTPISQAIRAVAPRTADTGQSVPGAAATFEVFAFSDALQATKPLYVRLDYTGQAAVPNINVTVGQASSNGAISGGPAQFLLLNNNTGFAFGATRYVYAASGDGSFLSIIANIQGQANNTDTISGVVIERTRDADGTANGNGYTIWRWTNGTDTGGGATSYVGATYRIYDTLGTALQNTTTSSDYFTYVPNQVNATVPGTYTGDTGYAYPVFTAAGNQPQGASKALALAYATDVPRVAPITLTQYGQPGTWLPMGYGTGALVPYNTVATGTPTFRSPNYLSPVFRWE